MPSKSKCLTTRARIRKYVQTYLKSPTVTEAAKSLNIAPTTLHAQIKRVREQGIDIPARPWSTPAPTKVYELGFLDELRSLVRKETR